MPVPQKAKISKAGPGEMFGDIVVDRARARAVYEEWKELTRAPQGDLRRPLWIPRHVKPAESAYRMPDRV